MPKVWNRPVTMANDNFGNDLKEQPNFKLKGVWDSAHSFFLSLMSPDELEGTAFERSNTHSNGKNR